MIEAAHNMDEADEKRGARERRDIVSGEVMPDSRLIRFVAGPDGVVVPDVAAKLPGRGLWVAASKAAIATAVEKKLFSRAAKAQVTATADLGERAEKALVSRMLGGSCEVPLAAYATWRDGALHLRGMVATPDGQRVLSAQASSPAPTVGAAIELGREVAASLESQGALDIVRSLSTASGDVTGA